MLMLFEIGYIIIQYTYYMLKKRLYLCYIIVVVKIWILNILLLDGKVD